MLADKRRAELLELVRRQGFAPLPDLAKALEVSESTIRRDLAHLESKGSAQRTHGGAFYTGPSPNLPHFELRQTAQWDKKQAIAHAAAALITDHSALLLDGGSTTYELARLLVGRSLQIVTNSLPVATLFAGSTAADLIIVGGYVHGRTGTVQGPIAERTIRSLNVRWAIISGAGVNDRGLFNSNLQIAATAQAMIDAAEEVVAVIDSTKFGHQSLAHICPLERLDRIVTDEQLDAPWQERIATAGVKLSLAPLHAPLANADVQP